VGSSPTHGNSPAPQALNTCTRRRASPVLPAASVAEYDTTYGASGEVAKEVSTNAAPNAAQGNTYNQSHPSASAPPQPSCARLCRRMISRGGVHECGVLRSSSNTEPQYGKKRRAREQKIRQWEFETRARKPTFPVRFCAPSRALKQGTWVSSLAGFPQTPDANAGVQCFRQARSNAS